MCKKEFVKRKYGGGDGGGTAHRMTRQGKRKYSNNGTRKSELSMHLGLQGENKGRARGRGETYSNDTNKIIAQKNN